MSPSRRISVAVLHCLTLILLVANMAFGQSFTATVRGTAKDSTGSTVPGVAVTITSVDRGTTQTTVADHEGRFVIPALQPGEYVLTVEGEGFKKFSSGRFTLTVQQQARRARPDDRDLSTGPGHERGRLSLGFRRVEPYDDRAIGVHLRRDDGGPRLASAAAPCAGPAGAAAPGGGGPCGCGCAGTVTRAAQSARVPLRMDDDLRFA